MHVRLFAFLPVSFVCLFVCFCLFLCCVCFFLYLSISSSSSFSLNKTLEPRASLKTQNVDSSSSNTCRGRFQAGAVEISSGPKIHHTNFGDPWPMISTLRIQVCPKNPGLPLLYIPIPRMGLEPSILFDREGSGFLGPGHRSGLALRQAYLAQPHAPPRTLHGLPLVLKVTFPDTSAFGGSDSRCCSRISRFFAILFGLYSGLFWVVYRIARKFSEKVCWNPDLWSGFSWWM